MASQTRQQLITIHILYNILSKGNQKMKFSEKYCEKYFSSKIFQTMGQGP